ncbi:hypothetical protein J1614_004396 [Plenodomus biglobosus]|nr:hypothetical protein J1614_004396 [Plenodomus biglobosus]
MDLVENDYGEGRRSLPAVSGHHRIMKRTDMLNAWMYGTLIVYVCVCVCHITDAQIGKRRSLISCWTMTFCRSNDTFEQRPRPAQEWNTNSILNCARLHPSFGDILAAMHLRFGVMHVSRHGKADDSELVMRSGSIQ